MLISEGIEFTFKHSPDTNSSSCYILCSGVNNTKGQIITVRLSDHLLEDNTNYPLQFVLQKQSKKQIEKQLWELVHKITG